MMGLAVTVALLADGLTATVAAERNPIALAILAGGFGLAAKLAEASLVLAAVSLIGRWRPGPLAGVVAVAAVVGGVVGTWSNL